MTKNTKYLILLALLYFAVSLVGILHHELWLDEAQHWLLARDSNSVSGLIENTRIEGHPLLWSFMLYGITRFTSDPFWMQFLHILISTTAVIFFLKKAPFHWIFKMLFIFGYFMIFEYNLISRNYNLGILFLFLTCAAYKNRQQQFALICLYLALACNTHLLFSVPALALFLTLLLEQIQNKEFIKTKYIAGYMIFGLGLSLIFIQIATTNSNWLLEPIVKLPFQERIIDGFVSFFKGIVAIPDFRTIHFWNSNFFVNLSKPLAGGLALVIYLLPLMLFKNRKTFFFVYVALIGAQVFFFITQRSATRFHGMTFILIIIGLWIENYHISKSNKPENFKLTFFRKTIIYGILMLHFCAGMYAYAMDFKYPFTSAKEAVAFLKVKNLGHKPIVSVSCEGTAVSAYLGKKVYFLCSQSDQSFCHWGEVCFTKENKDIIIGMLTGHVNAENNFIYVSCYAISNQPYKNDWQQLNDKVKIRFLNEFDLNILDKTNYFVYEVSKI